MLLRLHNVSEDAKHSKYGRRDQTIVGTVKEVDCFNWVFCSYKEPNILTKSNLSQNNQTSNSIGYDKSENSQLIEIVFFSQNC